MWQVAHHQTLRGGVPCRMWYHMLNVMQIIINEQKTQNKTEGLLSLQEVWMGSVTFSRPLPDTPFHMLHLLIKCIVIRCCSIILTVEFASLQIFYSFQSTNCFSHIAKCFFSLQNSVMLVEVTESRRTPSSEEGWKKPRTLQQTAKKMSQQRK